MDIKSINLKLILIIGITSLFIFIRIIYLSNPIGYESSFYYGLSLYTLIFLILSFILLSSYIILSNNTAIEHTIVILYSIIINSLWLIKYGKSYGIGDIYEHLYVINNIIKIGYLDQNNFYPLFHICFSILNQLTNLDLYLLYSIGFNLVTTLVYLFLISIIKKYKDDNNVQKTVSISFMLSPIIMDNQLSITPFIYSIIFIITYIYLLFNEEVFNIRKTLIQIILYFTLLIAHIQSAIFISIFYIISKLSYSIKYINTKQFKKLIHSYLLFSTFLITILLTWLFLKNPEITRLISHIFFTILNTLYSNDEFNSAKITLRTPIQFITKRINIISYTLIVTIIIVKKLFYLKNDFFKNKYYLFISSFILTNTLFYFFTTLLISIEFGISGRYVWIAALLYPLIIGEDLTRIIFKNIKIKYFIAFFVMVLYILSFNQLFPRPEVGYYSAYTTKGTVTGMKMGSGYLYLNSTKIMGGGDQFNSLAKYLFPISQYEMFQGSTNGILDYLGYNVSNYEHRHLYEKYISNGKNEYIFYEELMSYFVANPKYYGTIITISKNIFTNHIYLNKLYENGDFSIYKVK